MKKQRILSYMRVKVREGHTEAKDLVSLAGITFYPSPRSIYNTEYEQHLEDKLTAIAEEAIQQISEED